VTVLALSLRGVDKAYGKTTALRGLDLDVPAGALVGLIGPNGAGKTTAFGIVGGTVRPDAGRIDVLGAGPFDPAQHAGRVGLLPQDSELNPHTPVRDLLRFFGRLQGLGRRQAEVEADRVPTLVELRERAGSKIRQLSHGMRRRVAVAQALLGSPELVLLDEPTSGLDPDLVVVRVPAGSDVAARPRRAPARDPARPEPRVRLHGAPAGGAPLSVAPDVGAGPRQPSR